MRIVFALLVLVLTVGGNLSHAGVITFGTENCLGATPNCYRANNPELGATLEGLAPNVVTVASSAFGHSYPFSPGAGDFPGTDQIYVGSVQTASHDGYSSSSQRINGPDIMTLDFSSLIPSGQTLSTLTLGIAADDFQFPDFGQPFTATVNGSVNNALTTQLESLNESGPIVQFFTIGLNPSVDTGSHILTLSINEGGDGGDGWAVDFLTVGVTTQTSAVPEPSSIWVLAAGFVFMALVAVRLRSVKP